MNSESKPPELCLSSEFGRAWFSDSSEHKDEKKSTKDLECSLAEFDRALFSYLSEHKDETKNTEGFWRSKDELKNKQASPLTSPQSEPVPGLKNNHDSESKPPELCLLSGFGRGLFSVSSEHKDEMKNTEGFWRPNYQDSESKPPELCMLSEFGRALLSESSEQTKNTVGFWRSKDELKNKQASPLTSPQSEPIPGLKNNQDSEPKPPELCEFGRALFSDSSEHKDEMKNTEGFLRPKDELKNKRASPLTSPQSESVPRLKNNQDSESKPPELLFGRSLLSDSSEHKDEMKNTVGFWRPKDEMKNKQASPLMSPQSEPIPGLKNNQDMECSLGEFGRALFSYLSEHKDETKNTEGFWRPKDELKNKQASPLTSPQSEPVPGLKNNHDSESKPPELCLLSGFGRGSLTVSSEHKDEMKNTEGFWRPNYQDSESKPPELCMLSEFGRALLSESSEQTKNTFGFWRSKDELKNKQASPLTSPQSGPIPGLTNNQYFWRPKEKLKNKRASPLTSLQSVSFGGLKNNQDVPFTSWGLDPAPIKRRCLFCLDNHPTSSCVLKHKCPLGRKLFGEGCFVLCACGKRVVRGKCPRNCRSTWGRAFVSRQR